MATRATSATGATGATSATKVNQAEGPHAGEVKEMAIAGGELYEESLTPGVSGAAIVRDMAVVSADDQPIGAVGAVRANCVVVRRAGRADLYVPLSSVLEASEGRLVVNTLANQLERLGWETPPSG